VTGPAADSSPNASKASRSRGGETYPHKAPARERSLWPANPLRLCLPQDAAVR
jgi:hypothetical protein